MKDENQKCGRKIKGCEAQERTFRYIGGKLRDTIDCKMDDSERWWSGLSMMLEPKGED